MLWNSELISFTLFLFHLAEYYTLLFLFGFKSFAYVTIKSFEVYWLLICVEQSIIFDQYVLHR